MVLVGKLNSEIVELIHQGGGVAVGLTGSDGNMIQVTRRTEGEHDLGRVGRVTRVEPAPIDAVVSAGFVPVVAPIGVDESGMTYNVNADEVAGAVAQALRAEKLILLTDVEGVKGAEGELLPVLSVEQARKHISEGTIRDGMIPKVQCCLHALERGVARTHIIDGRVVHAVLLEIFTDDAGVGTLLA